MNRILGIILLFYSSLACSEGFKSEKDIRLFSDALIEQMVAEKFHDGFDAAKQYWPIPVVEIDGVVNQIKQQWPIVQQRFGTAVGQEFIKEERIGQSFLRYYYLHKFKKHAIYWKLSFYKAEKEWKINTVTFLDNLRSEEHTSELQSRGLISYAVFCLKKKKTNKRKKKKKK